MTDKTAAGIAHAWLKLDTGTHTGDIVALRVARGGKTVVSAGECTVRVWDVATRQSRRQLLGHTPPRADGRFAQGSIRLMALSPDGRWLVTVKDWQRIEVFGVETGNLLAAFDHPGIPGSVEFSPDGRWVALGFNIERGRHRSGAVQVFAAAALRGAGFDAAPAPVAEQALGRTGREDELSVAVRFIPAPLAALPWPHAPWRRMSPPLRPAGWGLVAALNSLTDDGARRLAWLAFRPGEGLEPMVELTPDAAIDPATLAASAHCIAIAAGPRSGDGSDLGGIAGHDHQGQALCRNVTEAPPVALAFSPNGCELAAGLESSAAAAGEQVALTHVYGVWADGFLLRSTYYGHDASVGALAWLSPEVVLSAGGDDYAIHLWDPGARVGRALAAMRGVGRTLRSPGIDEEERLRFGAVPPRLMPPNHPPRQQRFDLRERRLETTCPSDVDRDDVPIGRWMLGNATEGEQFVKLFHVPDIEGAGTAFGRPDLTLFVGADDEWVLWTRSGYYATNAARNRRFGYCVDRGPRQEALFFPADRFACFDRPDIVAAVIEHGSEDRARAQGVAIPEVDVTTLLPPIVEIERSSVGAGRGAVNLVFTVQALRAQQPPTRVWILRNGRFVWTAPEPLPAALSRHRVTLPLRAGRNVFAIHAESAAAKAMPATLEVEGPAADAGAFRQEADSGKLFLLSVGVSNFKIAGTEQAGTVKALRFAHRDAIAVYNALAGARRSSRFDAAMELRNEAFDGVEAALLIDGAATKAAILAQIQRLAALIEQRHREAGAERDVLFVFLSGHGTRFAGEAELYFWNWDLIPTSEDMERTGLSLVEFAEIATSVPAEVVLVIDACHSGMAGNNMMRGLDPEELARRIQAINERGMYIINAARSEELSFESDRLRQGVLTSAMLEALHSERFASPPARTVGMLQLMAGVQEFVPRMSARAGTAPQTSVCRSYGDLLPLAIYRQPSARRIKASPRLRRDAASATVKAPRNDRQPERKLPMATRKAPAKKAAAKKAAAPAKKTAAKKAPAKKAPAKKAPAKKTPAKKAPAKKAAAPKKLAPAAKVAPAKKKAAAKPAGGGSKPGMDVVRSK